MTRLSFDISSTTAMVKPRWIKMSFFSFKRPFSLSKIKYPTYGEGTFISPLVQEAAVGVSPFSVVTLTLYTQLSLATRVTF